METLLGCTSWWALLTNILSSLTSRHTHAHTHIHSKKRV
uniref:Uncharacterized protein n=1 Tax=Anguilla anguilla TaxID=7936 RepID=A0A0E9SFF2_ANGAN